MRCNLRVSIDILSILFFVQLQLVPMDHEMELYVSQINRSIPLLLTTAFLKDSTEPKEQRYLL